MGIARQKKMHGGETRFSPLPETLFNMGRGKIGAPGVFLTGFHPASTMFKTQTPADPEDRDRRFLAFSPADRGVIRIQPKRRINHAAPPSQPFTVPLRRSSSAQRDFR
ncbi:hypothetical protein [Caballeronia sp. KNU42]